MGNVQSIRNFEPVTMMLGGKERILRFDMNAYAELENKYGSVEKAIDQLQEGRMSDIRNILWVGLIHEEAVIDEVTGELVRYNITPFNVGAWIKGTSMLQEVANKLSAAMSEGMTEEEIAEANEEEETPKNS